MNLSGPDVPDILCRVPDGCCPPDACAITLDQWTCQVRQLAPEGPIWNPTLPTQPPETATQPIGAAAVGCMRVGCEQLVYGSCCDEVAIPCDEEEVAPQLALIDAFAAASYGAVQQLCASQRERDPCTAETNIRRWGERYGVVSDDPCSPQWSDSTISALICAMQDIRHNIVNADYLQELAARFGATITIRDAGDLNCGPDGWWTMARDRNECLPPGDLRPTGACPPEAYVLPQIPPRPPGECPAPDRPSINIVLCETDITLPFNCNLPARTQTLPHDPELYEAFKWLLPRLLTQPAYYCVYQCDPAECIQ